MSSELLIKELNHIVGGQHVTSDPKQLQAQGFLESSRPEVMVFPGNRDEVKKIMLFAAHNEIPVVPVGGGNTISRVVTPFQKGIGVAMSRLNRIQEFEPDNLSIWVEPGVLNRDLQVILNAHNLFLPVFPDHYRSTLGGEVAADIGTRKRYRYGSISDYVLGLEFISSQGQLVKTGGKTVKNVSGYDLTRLLAGSWGTVGVITGVTLKLKPLPEDEELVLVGFDSLGQAVQAAGQMMREKLPLVSLDVLYHFDRKGEIFDASVKAMLLIALEGSKEVVGEYGQRVQQLCSDRPLQEYRKNSGISKVWDYFHDLRRQMQSGQYGFVTFDKRDLDKISDTFNWFEEYPALVHLDIGSGIGEFSFGNLRGELTGEFVQRWEEFKSSSGLSWKTGFGQLENSFLLHKVLTGIDPGHIMFPANAIIRGVNHV